MKRDATTSPHDPRAYEDYDFLTELVELAPPGRREAARKRLRQVCEKYGVKFPGCGSKGEARFSQVAGANQEIVRAALASSPLGRVILTEKDSQR